MAFDWMSWLRKLLDGLAPSPPAPPPVDRYLRLPITGALLLTPEATFRLDSGSVVAGVWSGSMSPTAPGSFLFTLPSTTPAPYGATIVVTALGYRDVSRRLELAPFNPAETTVVLPSLTLERAVPVPPAPPAPPEPPPLPPPPVPPLPAPSKDAIVLSLAHVAAPDCPDVLDWPIVATISSFTLADREQFERGDTMVEFHGRDALPVAMGSQGAIAYTLWMGFNIRGQWHVLPIVECIRGYVPTGQLLSPGQLPQNLTYFASDPVKGYQPKPGEDVIFFCTTGDTRRQNVQAEGVAPGRTNVIRVPFGVGTETFA